MATFPRSGSAIAIICVAGASASAQPGGAEAQSLFDQGRQLMNDGRTAEACAAFELSEKLDPEVATLLNLGECRERNHQLATAWAAFVAAGRMARAVNDRKLARVARSHADRLEPRLSYLTITVAPDHRIAGLEILRGANMVDPAYWNQSLPIDSGRYVITARAPGRIAWSTTIAIVDRADRQVIEVPVLETTAGTVAVAASARTETARTPSLTAPIAAAVGAAALAGLAIGFELSGADRYEQAKVSTVQSERDHLKRSADDRRYVAEAFGVAAIGCVGAAVYLYLHRRDGNGVTPIASSRLAGLELTLSW